MIAEQTLRERMGMSLPPLNTTMAGMGPVSQSPHPTAGLMGMSLASPDSQNRPGVSMAAVAQLVAKQSVLQAQQDAVRAGPPAADSHIEHLQQLLYKQQMEMQQTMRQLQTVQTVQPQHSMEPLQQLQASAPNPQLANLFSNLPSPASQASTPTTAPRVDLLSMLKEQMARSNIAAGMGMMPASVPGSGMFNHDLENLKRQRDFSGELAMPMKKKRVYVKVACQACRSSHQACDEGLPCRNCIRSGDKCVKGNSSRSSENLFLPVNISSPTSNSQASSAEVSLTSSPKQTPPVREGRRYVKAACAACRKAHFACDNFRPCRNCVRTDSCCEEAPSLRKMKRQQSQDSLSNASTGTSSPTSETA